MISNVGRFRYKRSQMGEGGPLNLEERKNKKEIFTEEHRKFEFRQK